MIKYEGEAVYKNPLKIEIVLKNTNGKIKFHTN